jgi:hypothetical protein
LANKWHRKKAGEAISTIIKAGGAYKVLFFIGVIDGQFVDQDLTTMNLILDAVPEMENNYGIVVNKVPQDIAEHYAEYNFTETASIGLKLLTSGIPNHRRCAESNVIYVLVDHKYMAKKNLLIKRGKLSTVNGLSFEAFVNFEVPTIQLTLNRADDNKIENIPGFDEKMKSEELEFKKGQTKLRIKIEENKKQKMESDRFLAIKREKM